MSTEAQRLYWRQYRNKNLEKRREQARASGKRSRAKNPEHHRAYGRAWYAKQVALNPDWIRTKQHKNIEAYRRSQRLAKARKAKKSPEKVKEQRLKWQRANKDRMRFHQAKRKAMRANRIHPQANLEAIAELHVQARKMTKDTGIKWHVDHIIPVTSGGWEHELNMQLLPNTVNSSKRDDAFWFNPAYKNWRDVPAWLWPANLIPFYLVIELKIGRAA